MSDVNLTPKDIRVLRINKLLNEPLLFHYIELFFDDNIKYEQSKIDRLTDDLIINETQRDSLNRHVLRKKVYTEIKCGLRESLIEYMKLDDSDFTELGGAEYQEINGDH